MRAAKNILKAWRTGLALILWTVMFLAVNPAPTYADDALSEQIGQATDDVINAMIQDTKTQGADIASLGDTAEFILKIAKASPDEAMTNRIKKIIPNASEDVTKYVFRLAIYKLYLQNTEKSDFNSWLSVNTGVGRFGLTDTGVTDGVQKVKDVLEKLCKDKTLSKSQCEFEVTRITTSIISAKDDLIRKINASDKSREDKRDAIQVINNGTQEAIDEIQSLSGCPTVSNLRQRYQSGCWSCLVVNKLITAFLTAAEAAYEVGQRAGLVLLGLGAVLGILLWGLRNVSSMAQVDPWNILNDLMKFCFKILLAYLFITSGVKMVGRYIVNPIMGTGAEIAQQFWDDTTVNGGQSIRSQVEEFNWDDSPEGNLQEVFDDALKESKSEAKETKTETVTTPIVTEDKQKLLDAAAQQELKDNEKSEIPSFVIPGVPGVVTSYPGCRVRPKPTASASHMGLDVGGNNGAQIKAIGGGTIAYRTNPGGWGFYAVIQTKHKGNTWTHLYGHMTNYKGSYDTYKSQLNGKTVVRGQPIGLVGQSGTATGPHLHLEVQLKGKVGEYTYENVYLDPISLGQGKIVPRRYNLNGKVFTVAPKTTCDGKHAEAAPDTGYKVRGKPLPANGLATNGKAGLDLSSVSASSVGGSDGLGAGGGIDYSQFVFNIPEIKYTGPTTIMSKSVMNSIMGATRVITNTTAENLVLGHAITCYSGMDKGGAWHIEFKKFGLGTTFVIRNIFMWIQGALIWCAGFMLTLAVAYYLLDVCYKVAFAVIALPIVVGLWPFNLTKDKFAVCVSIIAKAAATFAFLAMTSSYGMRMVSTVLDGGESGNGLQKLLDAMDVAFNEGGEVGDENVEYVTTRLDLFSINFVLLMFAFIYFFRLVSATASELVNKFFPDNMFGNQNPMHQWSTAATKYATDIAKKPFTFARDVALNQTGRAVKHVVRHPVRTARGIANVAVGAVKLPSKAVKFAKSILGKKSVGGGGNNNNSGGGTGGGSGGGTGGGTTPIDTPIVTENSGGNGGRKRKHSSSGQGGSSDTARKRRLKNKRRARKKAHRK